MQLILQILWKKLIEASELIETGCVAVNTPVLLLLRHLLVELNKQVMVVKVVQWQLKIILNIKYTHFGILTNEKK